MACRDCEQNTGTFDHKKLCCAVRWIEKTTREDMQKMLAQMSSKWGHSETDLRAGIAELRRSRRKPQEEVRR